MWDVTLGTVFLFFTFMLIGIGPTLLFFRKPATFTLAVAPVLGLAMTTLIGTYLVSQDIAVERWAWGWYFIALLCSALLTAIYLLKRNPLTQMDSVLPYLVGLILCTLLLLAPMLIGGLNFTVLRGNGSDTFNYITMAGYLTHEPLSWVYSASIESLVNKHPNYSMAYILFSKTRWSTSMLLAWSACITHIPLYRFEFGFTTLFFILTYGVAYCFATLLNIRMRYIVLVALAVSVGFYAQFILDVRAMSQISALPLFLLLTLLAVTPDNQGVKLWWRGTVTAGITLAAITMLYIELLPTLALGFLLFFILQLAARNESLPSLTKKYGVALFIAMLALLPICQYLLAVFIYQLHYASSSKNTWEMAYFQWLYRKPVLGFWGFSIINPSAQHGATLLHIALKWVLDLLSTVMTGVLLYLLIASLSWKNKATTPAMKLSIALFLAAVCQLLFLLFREQYWAAGKAFTFGFPFIYFIIVSFYALQFRLPAQWLMRLCHYSVFVWLMIQCGLGLFRIKSAAQQTFYSNFISNHGEYRGHQWQVDHLVQAVNTRHISELGIRVSNRWSTEYLCQVFGWDIHVVNLNGLVDRGNYILPPQTLKATPDYWVVTANDPALAHAEIIARDPEFVLIKVKA